MFNKVNKKDVISCTMFSWEIIIGSYGVISLRKNYIIMPPSIYLPLKVKLSIKVFPNFFQIKVRVKGYETGVTYSVAT